MSYLSQPTSKFDYGIVKVGGYIDVDAEGVISVPEIIPGTGIDVLYGSNQITISTSGTNLINTDGTSTSYTVTEGDEYIGVNSTTATTITLPQGSNGRIYTIKDEHGGGMGKITVQPQSGEKIDGKSNYIIGTGYQGITIVFRAGGWWII